MLIEDDAVLADAINAALLRSGYEVTVARTAEEALHLARGSRVHLLILDPGLPEGDGLDLLEHMRREGMIFPILVVSACNELNHRIRALDAGADDYLVKPFAFGELQARVRAALRRADEPGLWRQIGDLRFDPLGKKVLRAGEPLVLTVRELAVLQVLMEHPGDVVPKQTLFRAVLPEGTASAPNAIEVHVSRLRQKLRSARVTVRSVRGRGYRIEEMCLPGKPL